MRKWIQIDPRDNVAAVLSDIHPGESITINGSTVTALQAIQAKHKFSLRHLPKGADVVMYGVTVGKTNKDVAAGTPLTTQNVGHHKASAAFRAKAPYQWLPPNVQYWRTKSWSGYKREDGKFGTRNVWLVIPLVFCENNNVERIRKAMEEELGYGQHSLTRYGISSLVQGYKQGLSANQLRALGASITEMTESKNKLFPNVDGLKFLTHHTGCGGTRADSDSFSSLVASYIAHPNCAGATVLSLGCQNAEMQGIRQRLQRLAPYHARKVVWLEQQTFSVEQDFLRTAITETFIGLAEANRYNRSNAPLSALSLGLECGGSDGFSGISANPSLGHVSDLINALGGNTVLGEFPELSGVEQNLVDRCENEADAKRFVQLMERYHAIVRASGSSFDDNPSPGNIRDGLITGAMKSAGAAKKGGTAPVVAVLDYTEPVRGAGLHLLCTPGNDVESTTALASSGVNMIGFTTGLGTPTGNPLVPVLKVSSNTTLALRMPDLIDYDAGPVIGGKNIESAGAELLELLIATASGKACKAELLGQNDFIPWKRDLSL